MNSPDTSTRTHQVFSQLLSTPILLIFCWLLPLGNVQAQLVDIELYITKTTENEEIGGVISYEFKVINLSPDTATGVVALIPFPAGLKMTVGFSPGNFNFNTGVWNIGTLEPWKNVTAGYTAEIGNIPPELTIYGQITAQDQQDVDSTPNNGSCCTANEDDESVLTVNLIDTGDDIDLELNIIENTSLANPGNIVFYSIELTNHGPSNATGVSIYGQLSSGLHFSSGHNILSSPSLIGNVRSGETIYRSIAADVLDVSTTQTFYVQVYGHDQTDSDSSPGNGICCTRIEDDEDGAILEDAMGAQIVDLSLELYGSSETEVGQDVYFTLLVYSSISSLPVNNLEIEILLPAGINVYNTSATVGTWDAANGIWSIPVLDPLAYNRIYFQAKVIDPPPLTFYAQVLSMDAIDGDATPGNGTCCVANEDDEVVKVVEKIGCNCPAIFAPVCGSDGITYSNSCEAECADIFDFTPGICNGQVDLELSLSTTNATPAIYSTTSLTATLTNNGIDPATGVSVHFPKPTGTVYLGSNEWSATQGTFLPFGSETWAVGILQPGASASLTVNYYMLTGDERTAYAQVATTNEEDVDSSPGNGVSPNVNEDDEAAVVLNGSVISCSINATVSNLVCNDHNTPNDPSDDWYSFTLSATNTVQSTGYQVYIPQTGQSYQGTYGSPIYIQSVPISFGNLILNLTDEVDVACIKNVTVTPPAPCSGTSGDIDLELSLVQPNASPVIYSNYDVVATLHNTSGQAATGVKVHFAKPTGVVYTGGNEFSASQGTFNPNGDQVWTVGTIPAGGSAILTVHYFLLQSNAPVAYAQVIAANEQDLDSTPNNGTPPSVNEDDEASTSTAPTQKVDLTLANLTMQNSPIVPGQLLNYGFDVSNIGTATASGDFNVRAWISMDNILGPGDIQGGLVTLSDLSAGATLTNVQGTSTIPSSFPDGDYFLFLKVDVDNDIAESNEDNNLISVPFVVDSGDGDLAELSGLLHEFIPGESNCYTNPGGSVGYLSVMIGNTGDVTATSFKVKFYLSTDDQLSSDDVLWSTETVPFLDLISINGPAFVSPSQVVPAFLAYGKYYVITTIDEDNEVEELDETNNLITPFQIQIGAYDIVLENYAGMPSTIAAGSSFDLDVQVSFADNGLPIDPSLLYTLKVEVLGNPPWLTVASESYLITDFNTTNVVTKTLHVDVPASLTPGDYEFRIIVNVNTCEAVGTDNYQTQTVTVTSGTGGDIDLELSLVQPNPTPVIYANYEVTATLTNVGTQTATGVKVHFAKPTGVVYVGGNEYNASQGIFNPNGDQIWTVGSIPAGGSATLTVHYFLLQSGAPDAYAQVITANEQDVDSTPGNGTPPTPNEDDEASTGGSQPPMLQPDLVLANFTLQISSVEQGQVLNYTVDISNVGNGPASGDFKVKAWISYNNTLSYDDIQNGVIPTGNFPAGFTVSAVPGGTTIPANLATGTFYLILKVDADVQIAESNESNNLIYTTFTVTQAPLSNDCAIPFATGTFRCSSEATAGQVDVQHTENGNLYETTVDANGDVLSTQSLGVIPPEEVLTIESGNVVKKLSGTSTVIYSKPIPTGLDTTYATFLQAIEYNNGFVLLAFKNFNPSTVTFDSLFAIRTDANLNYMFAKYVALGAQAGTAYTTSGWQVKPDRLAFTYLKGNTYNHPISIELYVLDDQLNVKSQELILDGYPYGSGVVKQTPCADPPFQILTNWSLGSCPGVCSGSEVRTGDFVNDIFVEQKGRSASELSYYGYGNRFREWRTRTSDGGQVIATNQQQVTPYPFLINDTISLSKTTNGNLVWEKKVFVYKASQVVEMIEVSDDLAFIQSLNGELNFISLACLEGTVPTDGIDLELVMTTTNPSPAIYSSSEITLTVNNTGTQMATGIVIEWKRPAGTVYTGGNEWDATQGTFNPHGDEKWTVGTLPAGGSASLTVSYFYLTANTLTPYAQVVATNEGDVDSTPGNGTCCMPNEDDEAAILINDYSGGSGVSLHKTDERQRLAFDRIYPNPAKYWVTMDIYALEDQEAVLDFYNQHGQSILRMKVDLKKGQNKFELNVSDWRSGTYNIIGRGNGHPAYGRFLKVWEE